jgi:phospholipid/cholesterol/gamma-HCH transport system permease protein
MSAPGTETQGDVLPAETVVEVPECLTCENAGEIERTLVSAGDHIRLDLHRVRSLDTFGLAALASGIRALRERGATVEVTSVDPEIRRRAELLRIHDVLDSPPKPARAPDPLGRALARIQDVFDALVVILAMLYEGVRYALADVTRSLGREHLVRQIDQIGLGAVPLVAGVNFLLGAILAFQTAYVLEPYGATLYVARGVGLSMTRELGPLMAAVLLAGRSGSAIAAEVGAMVVYEEVDALAMMALDPRRFLFSPRFAALVLSVPVLSIVADVAGILGSMGVMFTTYRLAPGIYLDETIAAIWIQDIGSGLIKSVFFGALIAVVACHQGLALRGGPEAVGRSATTAVVRSIIAVVIFDAAFTAATRGVL